jgi:hypothetical protein
MLPPPGGGSRESGRSRASQDAGHRRGNACNAGRARRAISQSHWKPPFFRIHIPRPHTPSYYGSRETVRRDQQMVPCRSDLAVGSGVDRLLWLREHAWNAAFFRRPRPGSSRPCGAIAPSGSPSLTGRTRGMLRGDSPGPTAHVRISTWLAVRALRVTRDLLASRAQLVPSNAGQRARHLLPVPSASLFPAYPGDPAVGRRAIAVHKGTAATWWRSIRPFAGRTLIRPLLGLTTAEASRLATRQEGRARTLARR